MALQLGRSVCAASKLPFARFARSYTSMPASSATGSAFRTVTEAAGYCYAASWLFRIDWTGIGKKYAVWTGESKRLEMLEKLDREKYTSDDAYLEALERELEALKAKLLSWECNASISKMKIFGGEMAGLRAMIYECRQIQFPHLCLPRRLRCPLPLLG